MQSLIFLTLSDFYFWFIFCFGYVRTQKTNAGYLFPESGHIVAYLEIWKRGAQGTLQVYIFNIVQNFAYIFTLNISTNVFTS